MRFEKQEDLDREENSIRLFIDTFGELHERFIGATVVKLGNFEIDYLLLLKNGQRVVVEIKGVRGRNVADNHTPIVSIQKVAKLQDCVNRQGYDGAFLVFAYEDGIKFEEVCKLNGQFSWWGREVRKGSTNDQEMILKFSSTNFLFSRYVNMEGKIEE